jgi:eukaryotic-like serine/threonine-protein kinase
MSEASGWQVPGYIAEELIGFGASGEVWRGRAVGSSEAVALKRLHDVSAEAQARLRREGALLAALDHPHLVPLREVVITAEQAVLVLDHAGGGSLSGLLRRRRRLTPGEVVGVVAPVATALAYAHEQGLVHADVTPANILLASDGRPLLADLGVARVVGETQPVLATCEYIDPAVAAGAAPGPATDVFMLAAVAVHALTGSPPWLATTVEDALARAIVGRIPELRWFAPEASEVLIQVLQRALSKEPGARGSAAEFALDVRHACEPAPVQWDDSDGRCLLDGSTGHARSTALTHEVPRPRAQSARDLFPPQPVRRRGPRWLRAVHRRLTWQRMREKWQPGWLAFGAAVLSVVVIGAMMAAEGPEQRASLVQPPHAVAGLSSADGRSPTGVGSAPHRASLTWLRRLDHLDRIRAAAYERGDPELLRAVYVPGEHLRSDTSTLRALLEHGYTARGVRHRFARLKVVHASASRVRLTVSQRLEPSWRVRRGDVVGRFTGTRPLAIVVDLVSTPAGWKLA